MDSQTPQGEALVEMQALRTLRIAGGPKHWQALEQVSMRLLQLLRPVALEELVLIGVDQIKVVRALISHPSLHSSLTCLKLGLHGFHFLAQEDLLAIGAPLARLRSLSLFGINANGSACRESFCRMFICATAFLEYLGQVRNPEEVEVLHISNAGILGDDPQIASLLRCLASFTGLRCLKLPLPSLPLSLREVLSLRLALPQLLFFAAEHERIEGSETWPEGDDWPPMTQVWPMCETITPLSVFSHEFLEMFASPGQAAAEWDRLSEAEQSYWCAAAPRVQQAYRLCEHAGGHGAGASSADRASDTLGASPSAAAGGDAGAEEAAAAQREWRAAPEVREPRAGESTAAQGEESAPFDAARASTYGIDDWRAEERSALRGMLGMKASDVCKEKSRLRKEPKGPRPSEGAELSARAGGAHAARAAQDLGNSAKAAEELAGSSAQQCCAREQAGSELGGRAVAGEL